VQKVEEEEVKVLDPRAVMEVVDIMGEVEVEGEKMELVPELVEVEDRELFKLVQLEIMHLVALVDRGVRVVETIL
jgi:hypothetical protein